MSIEFLNAAFHSTVKPSSRKFVLVALCDYCNEEGEAYPTAQTLSRKTGLNIKTVKVHLKALSEDGFISPTGRMTGRTKQIPVYSINLHKIKAEINRPKIGPVSNRPKTGPVKEAQNRAIEPSYLLTINKEGETEKPALPENLNLSAWKDWLTYRKQRRLPKYTTDRIVNRLAELPHQQQADCVNNSIDQTYTGIFPEKYHHATHKQTPTKDENSPDHWANDPDFQEWGAAQLRKAH